MTDPVVIPVMTAVPPFPALADRATNTYNSKAFAFGNHMSVTFVGQLTAVAEACRINAVAASERAATAGAQAGIATAKAALTAADAAATAADRVQTSLDRMAAASSAGAASMSAGDAAASAASAAAIAGAFVGTSVSNLTIGIGSRTFATQAGEQYTAGIWMTAVSTANSANWMFGQVTSYSGTTLILDVQAVGGSGTFASWNLSLTGARGAQGTQGPAGTGITPDAIGWHGTGGATPKTLTVDMDLALSDIAKIGRGYIAASGAVAYRYNEVNTSAGAIMLSLPAAPVVGDSYTFEDMAGTFQQYPLTLGRNGKPIMGSATDLVCDITGITFTIWFNGTEWRIK